MNHINDRLLVTGANGQLGRAVVEELLRLGATHVVATSRTPEKLADLRERGVGVRAADFDQPETLRSAFAGVDRLAIISTNALDVPGKRLSQHRAAIAAAVESGVKHVVYTSAPSPYPTAESSLNNDHFWTEAALFASPLTWTILRNQLYMELILMGAGQATKSGQLFSATGGQGRAYVEPGGLRACRCRSIGPGARLGDPRRHGTRRRHAGRTGRHAQPGDRPARSGTSTCRRRA